jgi:hypothetical protein
MSAKPKQRPRPDKAREFFYRDKARRRDAELHETILAEGDHAAAKRVSDKVKARILGKS